MDPDPEKIIPELDPSSYRCEMNLKENYFEKLVKFDNFWREMISQKYQFLFVQKLLPKNLIDWFEWLIAAGVMGELPR